MYYVVVCPECETTIIVEDTQKTTTCPRCQSQHIINTLDTKYSTDSKEAARRARGLVKARLYGDAAHFKELLEEGALDDINTSYDSTDFAVEMGVDKEDLASVEDTSPEQGPKERIQQTIRRLEKPTRETVIDTVQAETEDRAKIERILKGMLINGELVEKRDGLRLA